MCRAQSCRLVSSTTLSPKSQCRSSVVRCAVPALLLSVPAHLGLRVAVPDCVVLLLARFRALSAAAVSCPIGPSTFDDVVFFSTDATSVVASTAFLGRMVFMWCQLHPLCSENLSFPLTFLGACGRLPSCSLSAGRNAAPGARALFLLRAAAETKSVSSAGATEFDHYTMFYWSLVFTGRSPGPREDSSRRLQVFQAARARFPLTPSVPPRSCLCGSD